MYINYRFYLMYLCTYLYLVSYYHHQPHSFLLQWRKLQHRLPEILPLEHSEESLDGILNPIRAADLRFEGTLVDPLCQILLMLGGILGPHVRVGHDEALQFDAFADYEAEILDGIGV